jgi:hypothetical protein
MIKNLILGMITLSTSLFSHAGLISSEVASVDMVGIEVTALFSDGITSFEETETWSALSTTTGGISSTDWSLTLDGDTFGDFDQATNTLYGEWVLTNLSDNYDLIGLTVDAAVAGFVFDIESGPVGSTPGSDAGREFVADDNAASAVFTDPYSSTDLFGTLDITGFSLAQNDTLTFLTDTDKTQVPEPATMFTFALSLIAFTSLRKKTIGK